MQFDLQNRYLRMTLLWVLLSLLIGLLLYFIFLIFNLGLPMLLHAMVSMLAAGYIIYRFFSFRLG